MAFATTSPTEPRSWSVGPIKFQILNYTTVSGDTSGTVTADKMHRLLHVLLLGGRTTHSTAPTFSGNAATLAIVPAAAVKASLVVQDITYAADAAGTAGNSIRIRYTTGGTAGSEVVTVSTNDISVQIEDGVSTATQVKAAIDAAAPAAALVDATITGTAGTAQVAVAYANLAGGIAGGDYGLALCIGI